jgi:hypothetical protein
MKWNIPAALGGAAVKEKTVIQFDNEKRRKMEFLQMVFVAAGIGAVVVIVFSESDQLRRNLFVIFLGFGAFLRHYIKTLDKENAGLVISPEGIVFNGTELGRGLGLIAWGDIEAVDRVKGDEGECLYIRLKDPKKYTGRIGGEDAEEALREGVGIRAEGLKTGFEEMEWEIRRHFERHRTGALSRR